MTSGQAAAAVRSSLPMASAAPDLSIVVVLPPEAGGMLSRPLVYTALTRAQKHLSIVHAAGAAVARGVREVGSIPRRTRLAGLLRDELTPVPPPAVEPAQLPLTNSA